MYTYACMALTPHRAFSLSIFYMPDMVFKPTSASLLCFTLFIALQVVQVRVFDVSIETTHSNDFRN